ncbi:MAG: hypothetical protein KGP29_06600 [Proteobacteria bacterium]|nr:hypothetical protein [Pseudomonadota bacterium]
MTLLKERSILEISGVDRKKFLQGLITNDVEKTSAENLIYAAMLNASGRFLYDFFIFDDGEKLTLDCFDARRDEIFQKLNFYKLRSQVVIKKNDELKIFPNENGLGFLDPRNPKLGHRLYSNNQQPTTSNYHLNRISLKIPESENDLTYEKSLILEFGFDELSAIDYNKGCYVGQELTARTHYRGEIRKKIFHIALAAEKIEKNSEIYCEGKSAGIILSSIFHENKLHALALIKDAQDVDLTKLDFAGQKISVIS